MASTATTRGRVARDARETIAAYLRLTKPRIIGMLVVTTIPAMILAEGGLPSAWLILATVLGGTVVAGGANALNMYFDRDIDELMYRTQSRPVPSGQVEPEKAALFGLLLGVGGFLFMQVFVNSLAAFLTIGAFAFYIIVYTLLLKRRTPMNLVIGGAAGAAPPVLGWTAVTGSVDPNALLLFLIIYVWTPPHFWALAIHRRHDYAAVNIPMLPVTHGVRFTRWHILFYTILLVLVTTLPYLTGMSGLLYLAGVSVLNIGFLWYALRLLSDSDEGLPMQTFSYSVIYLMVLFVFLLADHYLMMIVS